MTLVEHIRERAARWSGRRSLLGVGSLLLALGIVFTVWLVFFAPGAFAASEMRAGLIDPEGARVNVVAVFKDKAGIIGEDETVACGTVNARNRLGGYVGERPFILIYTGRPPTAKTTYTHIAGEDWAPCEFCRSLKDYLSEDAAKVLKLFAALKTGSKELLGATG